jgi:hypothetical protein
MIQGRARLLAVDEQEGLCPHVKVDRKLAEALQPAKGEAPKSDNQGENDKRKSILRLRRRGEDIQFRCGLFTVMKSSGKWRIIFDARPANWATSSPGGRLHLYDMETLFEFLKMSSDDDGGKTNIWAVCADRLNPVPRTVTLLGEEIVRLTGIFLFRLNLSLLSESISMKRRKMLVTRTVCSTMPTFVVLSFFVFLLCRFGLLVRHSSLLVKRERPTLV